MRSRGQVVGSTAHTQHLGLELLNGGEDLKQGKQEGACPVKEPALRFWGRPRKSVEVGKFTFN